MIRPVRSALATVSLAALAMVAAACGVVTKAQEERNDALWAAARSCENGSLKVERVSNEGQVFTRTMNSSGNEMGPFQQCYREKARPIWQSYWRQEPDSPQCRR